jgi:hypothetical protein
MNDNRLYRSLDALLPHKSALEKHLKERLGDLFRLEYDLLLYDVTSTYFEGEATDNEQAQYGYSRDHRPDCMQVCIALVVSREGLPLGYEVFAGNQHDVTTVEDIHRKNRVPIWASRADLGDGPGYDLGGDSGISPIWESTLHRRDAQKPAPEF